MPEDKIKPGEEKQTVYSFRIDMVDTMYAPYVSHEVYESKEDLISIIKSKEFCKRGHFKETTENHFIEVPDDKTRWNVQRLRIFEMVLVKKK